MISKLPNVGTSIFSVMSQLAAKHGAINLAQGFPNFPVDPALTDLLAQNARNPIHQYTPMAGLPSLLEAIKNKVEDDYGRIIDSESELLVTAGATQGIFTTMQALIHPGDEVIILDPSYDCYGPAVILAGGTPIFVQLNSDFTPDWNKIESAISSKTKMIMTNNPHNPSGTTWDIVDSAQLEMLLQQHEQILWFSDEVYEHIVFESAHLSANNRPLLLDRTIISSSFGKTYHITGWKAGYLIAPKHLMDEIKKVHQYLVFSVNSVAQHVLGQYIPLIDSSELSDFYKSKRDYFQYLLKGSKFELLRSEGSYFQVARYSEISNLGDLDFANWLTIEKGVATIPLSSFNANKQDDKLIRFCYAKTNETLEMAADKLCAL